MSTDTHTRLHDVTGLIWVWVEWALALTLGLILVGGFFVLDSTAVRIVVAAMVIGVVAHLWLLHRNEAENSRDPRLREQRERRGF